MTNESVRPFGHKHGVSGAENAVDNNYGIGQQKRTDGGQYDSENINNGFVWERERTVGRKQDADSCYSAGNGEKEIRHDFSFAFVRNSPFGAKSLSDNPSKSSYGQEPEAKAGGIGRLGADANSTNNTASYAYEALRENQFARFILFIYYNDLFTMPIFVLSAAMMAHFLRGASFGYLAVFLLGAGYFLLYVACDRYLARKGWFQKE